MMSCPMPHRLATLACALCLLTPAAAPAAEPPAPVALNLASAPAALAAEHLEVSDAALLKGVRRLAIPLFSVQFVTGDQVSAETSGFAAAGRARSSAFYTLAGVGEADFQALAAALYQRLVQSLTEAGLEVVPSEQVLASPTWQKLAATGVPAPLRNEHSITVAPPGMAIYGVNKMAAGQGSRQAGGGLLASLGAMGEVATVIGSAFDTAPLQQELGGATLMEVNLRVHFVKLSNHNKGLLGRLASTAEVSGKAYPSIQTASATLRTAHSGTTLSLKQPLALDPSAIAEVREEAKSGGEIAGAIATGLLRMAIGNKDSESSARFQAVADPQRYRSVVGEGLGTVGQMFAARIKAAN